MSGTTLNSLRSGLADGEQGDERMEQIRELLVGDLLRQNQLRLDAVESRLNEMESEIGKQLDALYARIEALAGEVSGHQRVAFDELANSVLELSERISKIPRS